jgi:hypothetical protein
VVQAPADDNDAMLLAGILPQSVGPYVSLMMAGFLVAIFGHLSRSRWLIAVGIILIFLAAAALPLALNVFSDKPEPPGPLPQPY